MVIPPTPNGVLQVCHPSWRGVRASTLAFGDPLVQSDDLRAVANALATGQNLPSVLVIQGWPDGAAVLAERAAALGIAVHAVFHSSPAQHGVDGGESEALDAIFSLADSGAISRVGTVKAGVADAFRAIGRSVQHVPNRVPTVPATPRVVVPAGTNVGIFLYPMWRKNVTTQILAAGMNGWHPFVMQRPDVGYLSAEVMTEVGELPHDELLSLEASMTMAFNVTLSECHPMMPMEAYRLGVPCLMSRTSDLFADHDELFSLTTVAEADNPSAIAQAATDLLDERNNAVAWANSELDRIDAISLDRWLAFTNRH